MQLVHDVFNTCPVELIVSVFNSFEAVFPGSNNEKFFLFYLMK